MILAALISSAYVERGITGKVCLKSRDSKTIAPPKSLSLPFKSFRVDLMLTVNVYGPLYIHPKQ